MNTARPYLLVTGDFVRTGGMDMANLALASHLALQGNEVHLVTHRADEHLLSNPNIRFHRVAKPMNSYLLGEPLLDRMGRAVAQSLAAREGRTIVNGGNCIWGDVNWVHYVHAAYEPLTSGSALHTVKARLARRRALAAERINLTRARLVFCNSQRTRRDVTERLGVPESRVKVVYYGMDCERFSPVTPEKRAAARAMLGLEADHPAVVFIGALGDSRKGFDTLFASWQSLCADKRWDCDLIVVGEGAELANWKRRARENQIDGRIRFLGFRQDVPEVLAAADALVHPARYEAYGLSVREALTRGLPAIVSNEAGVAEHYPVELQGLLIPDPDDAAGLSERLWYWRRNMEAIHKQVAALSETMRRLTWEAMASEIVRLIEAA
ncbi:MAG: glycosyltransferase family 4 protein [Blastocatellia bacterium]